MPYLRDLQLVLASPDRDRYKQSFSVWEPIEAKIRRAIPSKFNFGGVGKMVIELGKREYDARQYRVLLNVGLYHFEDFDVDRHLASPTNDRIIETVEVIAKAMGELALRLGERPTWLDPVLAEIRESA